MKLLSRRFMMNYCAIKWKKYIIREHHLWQVVVLLIDTRRHRHEMYTSGFPLKLYPMFVKYVRIHNMMHEILSFQYSSYVSLHYKIYSLVLIRYKRMDLVAYILVKKTPLPFTPLFQVFPTCWHICHNFSYWFHLSSIHVWLHTINLLKVFQGMKAFSFTTHSISNLYTPYAYCFWQK